MLQPQITRYADGIAAVDVEYIRPGVAAAHIIAQDGRAAFVDTGTTHSVPYLLAALEELRIERAAVDFIFLTHVHLDHAHGAGALLQALPNARAVLHPRGAPHLIDPAKLVASARTVYGEAAYQRLYGELVPLPQERVLITSDLERLSLAGRPFEFVHTPGHALHHQAIVDVEHSGIFTGDTFGLSYREMDTARGAFIVPPTPPTQFDPEQLVQSIDRLAAYLPRYVYLMHYGRVGDVPRLARDLKYQVREFARIALEHAGAADRAGAIEGALRALWRDLARRHGCHFTDAQFEQLLGKDVDLNVQGLLVWLQRRNKG
ncbi:MAG TPA: MBL fold metallo-hydrolase [Steroidobacteraceae bacterium]|jgi:glyoxylase-like metal-dependent hydrolase (beta-lactamase superfamily II)|nr:MBL fold metallo-hydrolase [Steroidobacteraceae bacterium]